MASSTKLTYPQRLFLWLLGYSLLMVGCFVLFQYHREKEFKAEAVNRQLQLINTFILSELDEGRDPSDIRPAEFKTFDEIRLSVINADGKIIYDNTLDTLPQTNHLDRKEIHDALQAGTGYAVRRHSESTGNNYFYSARKGADGCIVRTAVPYTISFSSLLQADYGFLWVMGAVTLLMCVAGYFATRRVGQHIIRLNRFAESVERGARISDTEPFPHDELGDISNHIVRLYARLQQAVSDRDNEHRAALHEQLEKERIKKQLTNNINHELKTPVASIRICAETLLAHDNMSEENRRLFLQRIFTNTERLERLLNDVSLLTRMDDGKESIVREPLGLAGIIREVAEDRRPLAASKGIVIENRVSGPIEMTGNPTLLEAVPNNLIDNAIAYCGGTRITVGPARAETDRVVLELSDNGCGIPAEHLPRIFERFYRIDKGRSRAAGGTGLGLSIVKNAVKLHGGAITAENLRSGGLRFCITLSRRSG